MPETDLFLNPARVTQNGFHDFGERRLIRQLLWIHNSEATSNAVMFVNEQNTAIIDLTTVGGVWNPIDEYTGEIMRVKEFRVYGLQPNDVLQITWLRL